MPNQEKTDKTVKYHFIKSSYFRVIYSEGVAGGVSPRGMIQMTFFNERAAIPQMTVHEMIVNEQGLQRPGPEISAERISKGGIVRELESEVVMTLPSAELLYKWLGDQIGQLKKFQSKAKLDELPK